MTWVWMPGGLFALGLVATLGSVLIAKFQAIKRARQCDVHLKFERSVHSIWWDLMSGVCFVVAALLLLVELANLKPI